MLEKLKTRKAAGLDDIPPEIWKTGAFNDILLDSCNAIYNEHPIVKWMEGCILPFPKKSNLGMVNSYRGITLTAISAKIYIILCYSIASNRFSNRYSVKTKTVSGRKNPKNRSTIGQILTVRRIIEGVRAKNLEAVLLFVDFSKAFDSIHRGKMEQILLAYGISK